MADLKYRIETAATPGKLTFGFPEGIVATVGSLVALSNQPWPPYRVEKLREVSSVASFPASANSANRDDTLTGRGYQSLEMKLRQVHAQLSGAISAIDTRLDRVLTHRALGDDHFMSQESLSADLAIKRAAKALGANDTDALALVLDEAADANITDVELLDLARQNITGENSLLRTASARLLAVGDPALAREVIPTLLGRAPGRTARHILEVALRQAG